MDVMQYGDSVQNASEREMLFILTQYLAVNPMTAKRYLFEQTFVNQGKLLAQMSRVKVTSGPNGQPILDTGGKKRSAGSYSKDDVLSAAFLNFLVMDQIHNPENLLSV
ncbi:DNA packaging terminase subunit 1 [Anguillid herpesvirus 1]|nr:DNA packaging terminase subunit 1 [Anguillid herpesvirus 1]